MFRVQEFYDSGTDAAAGAAATAAASAAATVATTVKTVIKTNPAAEAAAPAAAPAAASVSEEKDSWTRNLINVLVFQKLVLHLYASERIRMRLKRSERVQTSPKTLPKTSKSLRKL